MSEVRGYLSEHTKGVRCSVWRGGGRLHHGGRRGQGCVVVSPAADSTHPLPRNPWLVKPSRNGREWAIKETDRRCSPRTSSTLPSLLSFSFTRYNPSSRPLHIAFSSYYNHFASYKPLFHTPIRLPTPPLPASPPPPHSGDVDDTRNINLTSSKDCRPSLLASSFPAYISQHTPLRDTLWLLLTFGQHQPNNRLATSKPHVCLSP